MIYNPFVYDAIKSLLKKAMQPAGCIASLFSSSFMN